VDGVAPDRTPVTGEALSQEAVPHRLVSSAIAAPAAWAEAATVAVADSVAVAASVEAVVAVGAVVDAGGDHPRKTDDTKEHDYAV